MASTLYQVLSGLYQNDAKLRDIIGVSGYNIAESGTIDQRFQALSGAVAKLDADAYKGVVLSGTGANGLVITEKDEETDTQTLGINLANGTNPGVIKQATGDSPDITIADGIITVEHLNHTLTAFGSSFNGSADLTLAAGDNINTATDGSTITLSVISGDITDATASGVAIAGDVARAVSNLTDELSATISATYVSGVTVRPIEATASGYAKSYVIEVADAGTVTSSYIDIPKDRFVKEGYLGYWKGSASAPEEAVEGSDSEYGVETQRAIILKVYANPFGNDTEVVQTIVIPATSLVNTYAGANGVYVDTTNGYEVGLSASTLTDIAKGVAASSFIGDAHAGGYIVTTNADGSAFAYTLSAVTEIGKTGSDSNIPTEQAVREAITAANNDANDKINYLSGVVSGASQGAEGKVIVAGATDVLSASTFSIGAEQVDGTVTANCATANVLATETTVKTTAENIVGAADAADLNTWAHGLASDEGSLAKLLSDINALNGNI